MTQLQIVSSADAAVADVRAEIVALLPKLRRFALGLTGSAERADDLVQDAVERALTYADHWQPGTRLDSWLYRIVQNCWLSQGRKAAVRNRWQAHESAQPPAFEDGRRTVEGRLDLQQVMKAYLGLSPKLRSVAALVILDGESYHQAAEVLGVPIGTVMSRVSRARETLREACANGSVPLQSQPAA